MNDTIATMRFAAGDEWAEIGPDAVRLSDHCVDGSLVGSATRHRPAESQLMVSLASRSTSRLSQDDPAWLEPRDASPLEIGEAILAMSSHAPAFVMAPIERVFGAIASVEFELALMPSESAVLAEVQQSPELRRRLDDAIAALGQSTDALIRMRGAE